MTALAGALAVVTGASRGIGAAIAAALATEGARVVRVARTLTDGETEGGRNYRCDLSDPDALADVMRRVLEDMGSPALVVNNAGQFALAALGDTSVELLTTQVGVNLVAPILVARALLPAMAGRPEFPGRHVLIGSIADHRAFPGNAAYAASKWGVRGFHAVLREEFGPQGIRCTLISPGPTDTAAWDPIDPDRREGYLPRRAMLHAEDVAQAVLFVATRPPRVDVDWIRLGPAR